MPRFHVHVSVDNLADSVAFYSKLFGQVPAKERPDYVKWMLDDPRVNFAISARGHKAGINHLGFQADSAEELQGLKKLAESASDGQVLDQGESACCYAKSEKHWTVDPQGLAWEHFHTMAEAQEFGQDTVSQDGACCIPLKSADQNKEPAGSACCLPKMESATEPCCNG